MDTHLPSPAAHNPADPAPLSEAQFQAVQQAKARRKKIDMAIAVATFNGWSLGILAALSALMLPFSLSLPGVFISGGLAVIAYIEFKGKARLKQLDESAPRMLGYNQIALGALIVVYCLWSLIAVFVGPDPYADMIAQYPELTDLLGSTGELYRFGVVVVYSLAILLTVPYQAAVAWYYFSRARHIRAYVSQTPAWITQLQRAAA